MDVDEIYRPPVIRPKTKKKQVTVFCVFLDSGLELGQKILSPMK